MQPIFFIDNDDFLGQFQRISSTHKYMYTYNTFTYKVNEYHLGIV